MHILLIKDEQKNAAFLKKGLEEHFHRVTLAADANAGIALALNNSFDLIIVDTTLPNAGGYDTARQIRQERGKLPILRLGGLNMKDDVLLNPQNPVDIYLTQPFHFEDLLTRIEALETLRVKALPGTVLELADLQLDTYSKTVIRAGRHIVLTVKEFILLKVLMLNKNRVLSRAHIAEAVWGLNFNKKTNLIDVYINYLRSKIDKGYSKQLIHTITGMGYMIRE